MPPPAPGIARYDQSRDFEMKMQLASHGLGLAAVVGVGSVVVLSVAVIALAAVYIRRQKRLADGPRDGSAEGGKLMKRPLENIKTCEPEVLNKVSYEDIAPQPKTKRSVLESFGFIRGQQEPNLSAIEAEELDEIEDGIGKLHFGLAYNQKTTSIQLNLIQAKIFTGPNCEDFFVRASLLPAETHVVQSKDVSMGSYKPGQTVSVNQTLSFEGANLKNTSTYVLMLHAVKVHGCQPFGEIELPLRGVKLGNCPVYWKHMVAPTKKVNGSLMVTLTWQPELCRMKMTVNRAKNLLGKLEDLDTYVKVLVSHNEDQVAARKTTVQVQSSNPSYEEAFSFDLNSGRAEDTRFDITLVRLSGNSEVRGRVVIGVDGDEDGFIHFLEILSKPGYPVPMWHKLGMLEGDGATPPGSTPVGTLGASNGTLGAARKVIEEIAATRPSGERSASLVVTGGNSTIGVVSGSNHSSNCSSASSSIKKKQTSKKK